MILDTIRNKAEQYFPQVQEVRHHLHAHPELSFHEHETAKYVAAQLSAMGIKHTTGVAGTGIVALIEGKNPGKKCIALRADMDALPIEEKNDVPYRSQNKGVMHACGHDVHTSCLVGAAHILNDMRDQLEGTVKLIFQPGEEAHPGGASLMIDAGVLGAPKPDAIFGLHVYPHLPAGTLGFRPGLYMASADEIYITIRGKGGHAAAPHLAADTIAIAALVITGLQQVISRKANPLSPTVLTFGSIHGGFATNVIPEEVKLLGTFRAMDEQWRREAHRLIKDYVISTCSAYGATVEIDIPEGYPCLYNDPALTERATGWARELVGGTNVHALDMRMGAEDFAFYTHHAPGCFFRIGTSRDGREFTTPVHNAHFNIDENALKTGMSMMAYCAARALLDS